ncbi:MAG: SusD/RagB family nutrient-binding outer membrane lipoprotein, partial [Ferruginibacter sp.]
MKKLFNYIVLALILPFMQSCDKGLAELNENKTSPTVIDPVFQLNNAIVNTSFPTGSVIYEMGIVQQIVTPFSGVLTGANFNQDNRDNTQLLWQGYYRNVIRNTKDVINRTKEIPDRGNLMNMARILQAYAFMVLTDSYGNIPYAEGGVGYINQTFLPVYDEQETIYTSILQELTEASAALNATGKTEPGDVLYGGNVDQWKKFGYSLLLRAGMRLSKVDATKAQQTVQAAFDGGVILSNADNALMRHTSDYANPIGNTLNSTEAANFYLAEPFVNFLKTSNDPRLSSIAIRYIGAKSGPEQTPAAGTSDPEQQIGMPIGNDNAGAIAAASSLGLASLYEFSQVDRRRMVKTSSPIFFVTAAQSQLLLAEAA